MPFATKLNDCVDGDAGHADASAITGPPAYLAIIAEVGVATGYAADAPAPGTTDVTATAQDRTVTPWQRAPATRQ